MLIKYAHEYKDIREAKEYMEMRKMSGIGTISSCLNLRYKIIYWVNARIFIRLRYSWLMIVVKF